VPADRREQALMAVPARAASAAGRPPAAGINGNGNAGPHLTDESDRLRRIDAECMSWGDTVHYAKDPLIVTGCTRDTVDDDSGHTYLDTGMWHSSCNFGYANQTISDAVAAQLGALPQVCGDYLHREKLLLAEQVVTTIEERTGVRGRVSFNVGGALAVEDALKLVRKHTGSYHGRSLGTLSLSSSHRYRQYYNEFADRAVMLPFADCAHCYYGKSPVDCGLFCGAMVTKAVSNEYYGLATDDSTEIGGMFIEAAQGRGYTIPPRGFYREFVDEMRRRGVLIVADEIQVGMFRTGRLFAFEHFGFVPDIITMGKSLTNGLSPLSLTWARESLVAPTIVTPGHTHSNFANHSLGTAAGLATWRYMMAQDYDVSVPRKGALFLAGLRRLKARHPWIASVDGLGLLANMVFSDSHDRPLRGLAKRAVEVGQRRDCTWEGARWRMLLSAGGPELNVLKFAPYLDITEPEIDRTIGVLGQILDEVGAGLAR
jgi:4-aminobutyrate aminotransferase-like enzyme